MTQHISEREIQIKLEKSIRDGKFHELIISDNLAKLNETSYRQKLLPDFSIDYYIREKFIQNQFSCLKYFNDLEIISTDENVSISPSEILRPDIICINNKHQKVVIFELKKSTQTERQALTELLAYKHEVKNTIPFLSDSDIIFVLIATEWNTLLRHASINSIIWDKSYLSCLHLNTENFSLSPIITEAWHLTGSASFPSNGVIFKEILFKATTEHLYLQIENFTHEISTSFEGAKITGFSIISEVKEDEEYICTIGLLNPLSFVTHMNENSMVDGDKSPLFNKIHSLREIGHTHYFAKSSHNLIDEHLDGISSSVTYSIRDLDTWNDARFSLEMNATPITTEFWGILRENATSYIKNPQIKKLKKHFIHHLLPDWRQGQTGIMLIDSLFLAPFLSNGNIGPSDAFQIGLCLGFDYKFKNDTVVIKNEEASEFWHRIHTLTFFSELHLFLSYTEDINSPPQIRVITDRKAESFCTEDFIRWLSEDLFQGQPLLNDIFTVGMILSFHISHRDYRANANVSCIDNSSKVIDFFSTAAYQAVVEKNNVPCLNSRLQETTIRRLGEIFKIDFSDSNQVKIRLASATIDEILIAIPHFLNLIDLTLPGVFFKASELETESVDWDFLKRGILQMLANGVQFPGVTITSNGRVGTADLSSNQVIKMFPRIIDFTRDVYVQDSSCGIVAILIKSWDDLIS